MVVNRKFEDIMDDSKKTQMKTRLGERDTPEAQKELQDYALFYHQEIVEILDMIKRELLLVLKTNNYLRAIDRRLGNPTNTFNTINEITWDVFWKEVSEDMSVYSIVREFFRYYLLKAGLFGMYLKVRLRSAFGLQVDENELKDFELDVMADDVDRLGKMEDSKTFEEMEQEKKRRSVGNNKSSVAASASLVYGRQVAMQ